MIRFAAASAAVAVAILSAGAASASDFRVHVGDLDFATARGATTFDRRIQGAAQSACVSGSSIDQARCRARFRTEVLRQLPDGPRTDYARARSGRVVVRTPSDHR